MNRPITLLHAIAIATAVNATGCAVESTCEYIDPSAHAAGSFVVRESPAHCRQRQAVRTAGDGGALPTAFDGAIARGPRVRPKELRGAPDGCLTTSVENDEISFVVNADEVVVELAHGRLFFQRPTTIGTFDLPALDARFCEVTEDYWGCFPTQGTLTVRRTASDCREPACISLEATIEMNRADDDPAVPFASGVVALFYSEAISSYPCVRGPSIPWFGPGA
jgi:hypothetical protein